MGTTESSTSLGTVVLTPRGMSGVSDDPESCWLRTKKSGAVRLIATRLRLAHDAPNRGLSGGKRLPLGQGSRAAYFVSLTIDEVSFLVEMVVQRGVDRSEFLQRLHPSKPQHRPFSSSEWQVRVFCSIILPSPHLAAIEIAQCAHCCRIGSKPVGDDRCGPTMPLQSLLQKRQCCRFISLFGDIGLQNLALVVHSAPQVMTLAINVGFAALRVTNTSSTCQRQWRNPRIRDTRCRRISDANIGPNRFHQNRTVSWQMSMPRSNNRSSTLRRLSGNRTYIMTTSRITSGDELKQRNGLAGVVISLFTSALPRLQF